MRILFISDVYAPRVNGVSTSIATFRHDLVNDGHHCTLVVPDYPAAGEAGDSSILRVPGRLVPGDPEDRLMKWRALRGVLRDPLCNDIDIVHIHTPFAAHYAGVRHARRLGVPVVATYHTYFEHYLQHYLPAIPIVAARSLARWFTRRQCAELDALISPSNSMADALRAYGVTTPIEVLPTGLPTQSFDRGAGLRFRQRHGIAPGRRVMLYVGRTAHEKNIEFLVDIAAQVRQSVADALLVIAGEGPALPQLMRRVGELGMDNHVQFIGYLDRRQELLDCYHSADVFVFASRTETQGLVLLEAMAQGTPVVSTAVMGTKDVLAGAEGAVVVPEERTAFANAVVQLLNDGGTRSLLGNRARLDARRWASRAMALRLGEFYQRVAARYVERPDALVAAKA
ncbi:MAG: glycosyltransferase [Steroidobacteraceae bacterium]